MLWLCSSKYSAAFRQWNNVPSDTLKERDRKTNYCLQKVSVNVLKFSCKDLNAPPFRQIPRALIWKTAAPLWRKNKEEAKWNIHKSQGLIIAVTMVTLAQTDEEKLTELGGHAPVYFTNCQIKPLSLFKMWSTFINKMYHHNLCILILHRKTRLSSAPVWQKITLTCPPVSKSFKKCRGVVHFLWWPVHVLHT